MGGYKMITIKSQEVEITTDTVAVSEVGNPPHSLAIKHSAGLDFVSKTTFQEYGQALTAAIQRDKNHPIVDLRAIQEKKPTMPEHYGPVRDTSQAIDRQAARILQKLHS